MGGVPMSHHAMQDDFSSDIQGLIEKYCTAGDNNVDKVERMQSALKDVQGLVIKGIDRALNRGADLESLVSKSDELSRSSIKFENVSRKFAKDGYMKDVRVVDSAGQLQIVPLKLCASSLLFLQIRTTLTVCAVLMLVFYALVAHACGGFTMPTCQ